MKVNFNFGSGVITLPASVIEHLDLADSIDLKVLLVLASDNSITMHDDFERKIAKAIGCRSDKVSAAVRYWNEAGVISTDIKSKEQVITQKGETESEKSTKKSGTDTKIVAPVREIPTYSGEEMERLLEENDGSRRYLLKMCQEITGRIYNVSEANKVIAMSDFLGLSNEHILMLFTYCKQHGKTSVQYIEKMAYNLYDEGIDTYDKLDIYFKRKEAYESIEGHLRTMFGIGDRELTTKEKRFVKRWVYQFAFSEEMLRKAYEITVDHSKTGRFNFSYMDKVLENWHAMGYTEVSQVEQASKKRAEVRPASAGSFSTDEFVSLALKKSYGTEEENAAPRAHSTSEYVTHALKKTYGIEDEKSSSNDEFLELPLFDEVKNEPFEEDHTYDTSEIFALVARRLTDENNKNKA